MNQSQVATRAKLGELALDAAISVETAQRDPSVPLYELDTFISEISKQFDNDALVTLRDESMFPYYSFALARSFEEEEPSRNEFPTLMGRMLAKQRASHRQPDDLEQIKQFCLAFHEAMVRAVQSNRSHKPYRDGRVR